MIFYLLRHAKYQSRKETNYIENSKLPLSSEGTRELFLLKSFFQKNKIDALFSSPFERARETAAFISQWTGILVLFDERLREQQVTRDSRDHNIVRALKKRTQEEHNFIPEGGESFVETAARFISFLEDITQKSYKAACIVSHREVMQATLIKLFSLPAPPPLHECSITALEWEGNSFRLLYLNKRAYSLRRVIRAIAKKVKSF